LQTEPLQWSCYREIPILTKNEILGRGHTAFFADYSDRAGLPPVEVRVRAHFRVDGAADERRGGGGVVECAAPPCPPGPSRTRPIRGPAPPQGGAGADWLLQQPVSVRGSPVSPQRFRRHSLPESFQRPVRLSQGGVGPHRA
jgi:hypothetical protein